MKRKILALILTLSIVFSAFALVSCGDDFDELAFNTKYIEVSDVGLEDADRQEYFIFYKNGTGAYHYYYRYSSYDIASEYTIKFKYTYVDKDKSAVMCFYDSIDGSYSSSFGYSTWTRLVTVSKNCLTSSSTSSISYYVNEKYVKEELKNFGKKKEE